MKNVTIVNSTRTTDANATRIAKKFIASNFGSIEFFKKCGYHTIEVSKTSPNSQLRIFAL